MPSREIGPSGQPELTNRQFKYPELHLRAGELPFTLAPRAVRDEIRRCVDQVGTNMLEEGPGLPELRAAISDNVATTQHVGIDPDNVIITPGSSGALNTVFTVFDEPGTSVLIPRVSYVGYRGDSKSGDMRTCEYELDDDLPDVDHIGKLVDQSNGMKIIILNSPANPTGRVTPAGVLEEIAAKIEGRPDVLVVSDEVFSHTTFDGHTHTSMARYLPDQTIVVDSVSKRAPVSGLRLGWMISPSQHRDKLRAAHTKTPAGVATLSQYAAIPVLRGDCDDEIRDCRDMMSENRDVMHQALSQIPGLVTRLPEAAFFCFPDVSAYGTSTEVVIALQRYGLHVTGGEKYGDPARIRVSYAVEPSDLLAGIERMQEAFADMRANA